MRAKLTAFTISGAIAGIAGALFVHLNQAFSLATLPPRREPRRLRRGRRRRARIGRSARCSARPTSAAREWFITAPEWYFLSTGGRRAVRAARRAGRPRPRCVVRAPRRVRRLGAPPSRRRSPARGRTGEPAPTPERRSWRRVRGSVRHPARGSATSAAARRRTRWSSCSASTPSTSSTARRSASCCRRSARRSASTCPTVLGARRPRRRRRAGAAGADRPVRRPRASGCRWSIGGALVWALFSGLTGLATTLVVLTIARSGSSIGKAVIDPTHNSLLADYYPIEARNKVYSTHRAANAVGGVRRPADRRPARLRLRVARAVPRVRHPDRGLRRARPAPARAGARPVGAQGHGRAAPRSSTPRSWRRRSPRAGASPTRCRRCAGSGGRCRSSPSSLVGFVVLGVAALRAGVRPRRAGPRRRRGDRRAVPARRARATGRASPPAASSATSPGSSASSPRSAWRRRSLSVAFALVAEHRRRRRPQLRRSRRRWRSLAPGHPRHAVARHPGPGAGDGLLHRLAVGRSPACSSCRSIGWIADTWTIRVGMLVMLPLFFIGSAHPRQRVEHRSPATSPRCGQAMAARSEALLPPPAGRRRAAHRPQPRRRLRRPAGAVRRRHGHPRGPDRRPARHQRRRQEHAAEVDQRRRRGRPGRDRARRPGHHPRPAERDRRPRHRPGAGRRGRVRRR